MEATISTWNRFSKIFRAWKVLRHFRNYFANPNHPEFWQPFLTFGIIAKFSDHSEISEFFYTWRVTTFYSIFMTWVIPHILYLLGKKVICTCFVSKHCQDSFTLQKSYYLCQPNPQSGWRSASAQLAGVVRVTRSGAPKENIVQNHLNIAFLNVFQYLNGRYRHIFIP